MGPKERTVTGDRRGPKDILRDNARLVNGQMLKSLVLYIVQYSLGSMISGVNGPISQLPLAQATLSPPLWRNMSTSRNRFGVRSE